VSKTKGGQRKESKQVNFRISVEEHARLEKMANDIGMSVSGFCKSKALGIKTRVPVVGHSDAVIIASELRRIGVNINQMTKYLNSGGGVLNEFFIRINDIQEDLRSIWRALS